MGRRWVLGTHTHTSRMRTLPQWTNQNKFLNLANKRIMDWYCRQCVKPCNHRIGCEHHIFEWNICVCRHSSILSATFAQKQKSVVHTHICPSNHRSPWHSKSIVSLINILLWLTIDGAQRACHQWKQKESFSFLKSFFLFFFNIYCVASHNIYYLCHFTLDAHVDLSSANFQAKGSEWKKNCLNFIV